MKELRRKCTQCERNRAERFFTSPRGRICSDCRKRNRSNASHEARVTRTYGLAKGEYDQLLQAQGGRCAICDGVRRQRLSVDHDHTTGWVRGLVCRRCNRLLADVRDDSGVLRSAATYLDCPPAQLTIGKRTYHVP